MANETLPDARPYEILDFPQAALIEHVPYGERVEVYRWLQGLDLEGYVCLPFEFSEGEFCPFPDGFTSCNGMWFFRTRVRPLDGMDDPKLSAHGWAHVSVFLEKGVPEFIVNHARAALAAGGIALERR